MGLEKVKDEVLDRAEKEAEKIMRKAEEEGRLIVNRAEQKAKEIAADEEKETSMLLESMKSRELMSIQLEVKKLELEAKKDMVNEVFKEAEKKLRGLSGRKREEHIKKLLDKVKKEIDAKHVYYSKNDMKLSKNEDFGAKEADISGGIIAENEDGSIRVDYSYETLLESIKETHLQDIAGILFTKNEK